MIAAHPGRRPRSIGARPPDSRSRTRLGTKSGFTNSRPSRRPQVVARTIVATPPVESAIGRAPGGSLENNANRVAPAGQGLDHRAERWAARGVLWTESSLKRCQKCGRVTITPDGSVQVRANGAAVGFAGLASCGSVWVCPVCNARVQAVRRLEVGVALVQVLDGGGAAFGAYTVRHHLGSRLDPLWRGLSASWAAVG